MDWGTIIPTLIVGGFGGWLWGVVQGHGDTQQQLAKQERKLHALLTHLYRGQGAQIEITDLLLSVMRDPENAEFYWESWCRLRADILTASGDDKTGFFAEMHKA